MARLTKKFEICKLLHFYGLVYSEGQLEFSKKRKFEKRVYYSIKELPMWLLNIFCASHR